MVIEAIDEHFEITDARVDNHTKTIYIERVRFAHHLNDIPQPLLLQDAVIIALNEAEATTVESSILSRRQNSKENITSEELDGLLFKALWSFINQHRAWAARKMDGNELDLVLAHVEIGGITIDDHHVVNPIGLSGKACTVQFRGTFVLRDLLESLSRCASWASTFFIVERGSVVPSTLLRESTVTVSITGNDSTMFMASNNELKFSHQFSWGRNRVLNALAEQLCISYRSANKILQLYNQQNMSERMIRVVEHTIQSALTQLFKELPLSNTRARSSAPNTVYVTFHEGVPLPQEEFEISRVRIAPIEKMLSARDFSIVINHHLREYTLAGHHVVLSLLGKLNNYPVHQFLTQLLARRARWLTATISHTAEHVA